MTHEEYLKDHHAETETTIGTVKLLLTEGMSNSALKYLYASCDRLDELEKKFKASNSPSHE